MRESTVFYRSFYEAIKELDADMQSQVYCAIFEYALNFNQLELTGVAKTVFTLIKPQLDANQKRYDNGNKPKLKQTISKTEAKPKQDVSKPYPNANVNDNVNDNDNENVNENENVNVIRSRFRAPTYDEILNCMKSKNEIAKGIWNSAKVITEAKAFFNHYESNGWMVGKNKMKNWEAAIRNWMNNNSKFENQKQNTNGKQSNSTSDSIAKAEQLYAEAVAISRARDNTRPDRTTTEA